MHRVQRGLQLAGILTAILLNSQPAHAQYTANFQTNIISGVTSNWTGNYYFQNIGDVLLIQNSGILSNGSGYLGFGVGSSNNLAFISGSGSLWKNVSDLYLGYSGKCNNLIISNGGRVSNNNAYVGYNISSSNNTVTVLDAGSVWDSSAYLNFGWSGSQNSLVISNGGKVLSGYEIEISYYYNCLGCDSSSSNNQALVTDPGSYWTNRNSLNIGDRSSGNSVVVSNGGKVANAYGNIGNYSGGNNSCRITGVNSVWTNRQNLYIGSSGTRNSLIIEDGGAVVNLDSEIGSYSTATSNTVVVAGTGSVWSVGGTLSVGRSGIGNSLLISNGATVLSQNGYVGFAFPGSNNVATVAGQGSTWSNQNQLFADRSGNFLAIKDGGQVFSGSGSAASALVSGDGSLWSIRSNLSVIGSGLMIRDGGRIYSRSTSAGNVSVTGTGSMWSNELDVLVGQVYSDNALLFSNNSQIVSANCYIGSNFDARSSTVRVVDGASWKNGAMWLGIQNKTNLFVIDNATVTMTDLILGLNPYSLSNLVQVNTGSLMVTNGSATSRFVIGSAGQGSLVLNGGTVTVDSLIATNGTNSIVVFNGGLLYTKGTTLLNSNTFVIGDGSQSAIVHLSGGFHSFGNGLWVRTNSSVQGCGTVIIHGDLLCEGALALRCATTSFCTGTITNYGDIQVEGGASLIFYGPVINYGQIVATNGIVRYYSTFQNTGVALGAIQDAVNLWISPSSDKWEDAVNWSLGTPTNWHHCVITNSTSKTVKVDATSASMHSNTLTILHLTLAAPIGFTNTLSLEDSGTATPLRIADGLVVSSGGNLVISNGTVEVSRIAVGDLAVDGKISVLSGAIIGTNVSTFIGQSDAGQAILSGGTALTRDVFVGSSSNASGSLTITGNGSLWNCTTNLYVGWSGVGDSLVISNHGQLANVTGYLGYNVGSSNNTVLVTDSGSVWTNGFQLYVGYSGAGNSLVISNGGKVVDGVPTNSGFYTVGANIGYSSSSSNNSVVVVGSGSTWISRDTLKIGYSGRNNSLEIGDGGKVVSAYGAVGSISNRVQVSGIGSLWSNVTSLIIDGSDNSLIVEAGGSVVGDGGVGGMGRGNLALITDSGSVWSNRGITIGTYGVGNALVISNGGRVVTSGSGYWGIGTSDGYSNKVFVTGLGSTWNVTSNLFVGYNGYGLNCVQIETGGQVFNGSAYLGYGSYNYNPSGNVARVNGSGAIWSNRNDLVVGWGGDGGNALFIGAGGKVFNNNGCIGSNNSYYGNSATVSGTDSAWYCRNNLYIGFQGSANSLTVDGGSVFASNLVVGVNSTLCSNILRLDSGNVTVTNAAHNATFEVRRGRLILNGGTLQVDRFVMTDACAQFVRTGGTLIYGTAILDPNRDDDGDGIPNGWEQSHGLDPLNPADVNVDSDGDGMSNLQEYLAGTDPQDSASALRIIGIAHEGDDLRVTWTMGSGKTNALQMAAGDSGLYTNSFVDIFTVTNTVGSVTNYLDAGAATNGPGRFYRVRLVP